MEIYNDADALSLRSSALSATQQDVPEIFRLEELNGLNLYEVSIAELQEYFSKGQLTSVEYVNFCLDRVRKVNPYLECVIEINPDAVDIAAALDEERKDVCGISFQDWSYLI